MLRSIVGLGSLSCGAGSSLSIGRGWGCTGAVVASVSFGGRGSVLSTGSYGHGLGGLCLLWGRCVCASPHTL